MKRKILWLLPLLSLLAVPCVAAEVTLPCGSRYAPSGEEAALDAQSAGIYLLPGDHLAEVWLDGVRLFPGEARMLTGTAALEIVPVSDGCYQTAVRYIVLEQDGSRRLVDMVFTYDGEEHALPVAAECSAAVVGSQMAEGRLSGSSDYGEVRYVLVSAPQKGRVELEGDRFCYYPYDGMKGNDYFRYAVVDKLGRLSLPARVSLHPGQGNAHRTTETAAISYKKRDFLYAIFG